MSNELTLFWHLLSVLRPPPQKNKEEKSYEQFSDWQERKREPGTTAGKTNVSVQQPQRKSAQIRSKSERSAHPEGEKQLVTSTHCLLLFSKLKEGSFFFLLLLFKWSIFIFFFLIVWVNFARTTN